MNLNDALGHLQRSGTDKPTEYEALRVVGRDLATRVTLAPGAVAVAVGREAMELQDGAYKVLGAMRVYAANAETDYLKTCITWVNAPPPADIPIIVFTRRIVTGRTLLALLKDIPRVEAALAVTVVAVDATSDGITQVTTRHPGITIHTADTDVVGAHQ